MKALEIIFVLAAYAVVNTAVVSSVAGNEITFPTLSQPTVRIGEIGGCNLLLLCTNVAADAAIVTAEAIVYFLEFVINLVVYVVALIALIATTQFTGVKDAPGWFNGLLILPYAFAGALIIYKAVRKGDDTA